MISFLDQELLLIIIFLFFLGSVISSLIGMKFGEIVLQVNSHQLTESYFWYDVIIGNVSVCVV